jgi:hypothetical protein
VCTTGQKYLFSVSRLLPVKCSPLANGHSAADETTVVLAFRNEGDENMLGIIAAVLIVLWLLGFVAFHVTGAFIHVALVLGVVLLVVHFMRGSTASA